MSSFVKIYGSILRSSVWQQPLATKVVWITMLALADSNGVVESSVPGLAVTAGVTLEDCEAALACFLAPDKYSGSDVDEGRRIRVCRGGWIVVNHGYYRELRTERQVREAERLAGKRAKGKASPTGNTLPTPQHVANVAAVAPDPDPDPNTEISISSDSAPPTLDAGEAPTDSASEAEGPTATTQAAKTRSAKVVFDCWQTEFGKQRSKFDQKRQARIKARLAEGFTVDQLSQAIRGAKRDPYLMGTDPNAKRAFDGIETILRDAAQVERLIALEEGSPGKAGAAAEEKWL